MKHIDYLIEYIKDIQLDNFLHKKLQKMLNLNNILNHLNINIYFLLKSYYFFDYNLKYINYKKKNNLKNNLQHIQKYYKS